MQIDKKIKRRIFKSPLSAPLAKAIAVHLLLLVFMIFSFNSHQSVEALEVTVTQPKTIQAKAISSADVEKMVEAKQQKENAAIRAEQERKRRIQQERDRKRQAEQDKKRKAEQEKQRKADAARKKREEEERKKKELEQQKAEQERKQREEEARKKREQEERIRAEQEARERAATEQRLLTERDKYTALIKSKISRNWIVGNNTGQCVLEVRLAPGGLILGVNEISGGADLCRSAKAAVYKSEPLPVATDPAVFDKMRTLRLTLDPRDN